MNSDHVKTPPARGEGDDRPVIPASAPPAERPAMSPEEFRRLPNGAFVVCEIAGARVQGYLGSAKETGRSMRIWPGRSSPEVGQATSENIIHYHWLRRGFDFGDPRASVSWYRPGYEPAQRRGDLVLGTVEREAGDPFPAKVPAGSYAFGDPVYLLHRAYGVADQKRIDEALGQRSGAAAIDGHRLVMAPTTYGDGLFAVRLGATQGRSSVDSGTLGLIPWGLIQDAEKATGLPIGEPFVRIDLDRTTTITCQGGRWSADGVVFCDTGA